MWHRKHDVLELSNFLIWKCLFFYSSVESTVSGSSEFSNQIFEYVRRGEVFCCSPILSELWTWPPESISWISTTFAICFHLSDVKTDSCSVLKRFGHHVYIVSSVWNCCPNPIHRLSIIYVWWLQEGWTGKASGNINDVKDFFTSEEHEIY